MDSVGKSPVPHPLPSIATASGAQRAAACSQRLSSLWLSWFLCLLFHTDLGLMPLFHGLSPEIESQVPSPQLSLVFWAMLLYFLAPLAVNLVNAYAASSPATPAWRRWRWFQLGFGLLYTLTNLVHLLVDILIPDSRADQVLLMAVMVGIGLLINRESWRWCRC
ncbi:MAG: hypothetical protein RLZZ459_1218 [Cyanobacteriota bacterium]|jgi:hypothetical protein